MATSRPFFEAMMKWFSRKMCLRLGAIFVGILALGTVTIATIGLIDRPGKADVGLVLGSKVERDGQPSKSLRARLDRATELYHAGYFPHVIVSGGVGKEGFDEAVVMRDYLVERGIPAAQIIVDSAGNTTYLSAQNTQRIAQERRFTSVFVVTQYFHVPRSRLALQRFGLGPIYSAHARLFDPRDVYSSPRELVGYLSYCLRDYPAKDAGGSSETSPGG